VARHRRLDTGTAGSGGTAPRNGRRAVYRANVVDRNRAGLAEARHGARPVDVAIFRIYRAAEPPVWAMMVVDRAPCWCCYKHPQDQPNVEIEDRSLRGRSTGRRASSQWRRQPRSLPRLSTCSPAIIQAPVILPINIMVEQTPTITAQFATFVCRSIAQQTCPRW
jgi:hypothetical protein